jgi:hypothetical protein
VSQLITVEQLVNVNKKRPGDWQTFTPAAIKTVLAEANAVRPKEIVNFVEALTRMFGRIGMHGVCRLCFKGVNFGGYHQREPGRGCCNGCPLLLKDRCANKPMGCGAYMCGLTGTLFPRTRDMLSKLRYKVSGNSAYGSTDYISMGCFGGSVDWESHLKLTPAQKRRLWWAIRKLDAWSEREQAA